MDVIIALSASSARRIGEIGFIIGAVGGVLVMLAALRGSGGSSRGANPAMLLAGLCIAVGFVLGIVYIHWL
jgi:hypothetical protein